MRRALLVFSALGFLGCSTLGGNTQRFVGLSYFLGFTDFISLAGGFGKARISGSACSKLRLECFSGETFGFGALHLFLSLVCDLGTPRFLSGDARCFRSIPGLFGFACFFRDADLLGFACSLDLARLQCALALGLGFASLTLRADSIEPRCGFLELAAFIRFGAGAGEHLGFICLLRFRCRGTGGFFLALLSLLASSFPAPCLLCGFGALGVLGKTVRNGVPRIGCGFCNGGEGSDEQYGGKSTGDAGRAMVCEAVNKCSTLRAGHRRYSF